MASYLQILRSVPDCDLTPARLRIFDEDEDDRGDQPHITPVQAAKDEFMSTVFDAFLCFPIDERAAIRLDSSPIHRTSRTRPLRDHGKRGLL